MENINIYFDKNFNKKEKHLIVLLGQKTNINEFKDTIKLCINDNTSLIIITQEDKFYSGFNVTSNIAQRIDKILKFLLSTKNILPSSKLFLWGNNVGCCLAYYICMKLNNIRGVYLCNPIMLSSFNIGVSPNNTPMFYKYNYHKNGFGHKSFSDFMISYNYNLTTIESKVDCSNEIEDIDIEYTKLLLNI